MASSIKNFVLLMMILAGANQLSAMKGIRELIKGLSKESREYIKSRCKALGHDPDKKFQEIQTILLYTPVKEGPRKKWTDIW